MNAGACVVVVVQIDIVDSIVTLEDDGTAQNPILHRFQAAALADPFSMTWNFVNELDSIRIVAFGLPIVKHCNVKGNSFCR